MNAQFFEDGGFTMFPLLALGFCLVAAAVLNAMRPQQRFRAVTISLGGALGVGGLLGFVLAVIATLRNTREVPDEVRAKVIVAGFAESANNLVLALVFLLIAALISVIAAWRMPSEGARG